MRSSSKEPGRWAVAIHGGAGPITPQSIAADELNSRLNALQTALRAAANMLAGGAAAIDAVEPALHILEDHPGFNAGRGAVFTAAGRNELDAAIMDGRTMEAGAVAGLRRTRHPISAARAVMDKTPHVFLIGPGADAFAEQAGLEQVDPSFFFVEHRWQDLVQELRERNLPVPKRPRGSPTAPRVLKAGTASEREMTGTVGIVVLDRAGNVAAGTSTGGLTAKRWGRVGDSPIIGAGTYASNDSCAVSATGTGEFFIRFTAARDVGALLQYRGMKLREALGEVLRKIGAAGGSGGLIAVSPDGQLEWSFNTRGMLRGELREGGQARVFAFGEEQ